MKTRLCDLCVSGKPGEYRLCGTCKADIESSGLTETYIDVAQKLNSLSGKYPALEEIEFKDIISTGRFVIIALDKDDYSAIEKDIIPIAEDISKTISRPVKIIDRSLPEKDMIRSIIEPFTPVSINMVFSDGEEILKLIMPQEDKEQITQDFNAYETAIKLLTGKNISVAFE